MKRASDGNDPVLIVGGGFSGTLLAINLARLGVPSVLFERDQTALAKGLAFGTRHPEHLLNVRASNMSAFPDDPQHFLRWLGFSRAEQANRFVPRLSYGQYLREILLESLGRTSARLAIRSDNVVDLREDGDGVIAVLANGATVAGRAGVLALGHFAPRLPGLCRDIPSGLAVSDPWRGETLADLDPDAPLLLLGTGLTSVDVILSLDKAGHRGPITALSRRGLMPRSHLPSGPAVDPVPPPAVRGIALLRAVRARAQSVGWHHAVDELRPHTRALWQAHDNRMQARFLRHLRPYWDVHRHRLAPTIATRLAELVNEGRVTYRAGRLVDARQAGNRVAVTWRPRGTERIEQLEAARVINCIGPEGDIAQAPEPLLKALLERGTVRPDTHRMGLDVDPDWRVRDEGGNASPRIHAVGPLTKGIAWEIIAVPDIRHQVWELARQLAATRERVIA